MPARFVDLDRNAMFLPYDLRELYLKQLFTLKNLAVAA